jgi:hypothetical protein
LRTHSPALVLLSCLASLSSAFTAGGSFTHFLASAMARVKSTARHVDVATKTSNEGRERGGSAERMESVPLSDAGSHSGAGGDVGEGSRTRRYYFRSLTVMVSRIGGMIDHN